jgi:hypothetical protein
MYPSSAERSRGFPSASSNQSVLGTLSARGGGMLQTKLAINQLGDRYEQEADRIAEQVMSMPNTDAGSRRLAGGTSVVSLSPSSKYGIPNAASSVILVTTSH